MTDLMKALSSMYEKSLTSNKVHLMGLLFNLGMAEVKRSDGDSRVNHQSLQYCIQNQENYGKTGHYKNQCKSAPKNQEAKDEANIASTSGGGDALICSLESKKEFWVLDSGASFHATS
ncbi:hypothetical protein KIW84_030338 [Lathyrus oleraceus]|uniref:Uncharacterized protein n=1 Tax=Pisum sativum TaxID=3888 RepID=A0A9D4XP25_PEA|nr:hypothetical protein KIW84_030338 [Pisum sativum]